MTNRLCREISHARYAYCAFVSKVLVAFDLAGKRRGKPGCPFDAFALPGGYCCWLAGRELIDQRPPAVRPPHFRSRVEHLLAIAREKDAGGKTASTRGRWKIVRVVSGWGF